MTTPNPSNPSAPDTGSKCVYPSDELMLSWRPRGCACSICFTAAVRKALDWQREQDALILDRMYEDEPDTTDETFWSGLVLAAQAIRAKSQEGEHD